MLPNVCRCLWPDRTPGTLIGKRSAWCALHSADKVRDTGVARKRPHVRSEVRSERCAELGPEGSRTIGEPVLGVITCNPWSGAKEPLAQGAGQASGPPNAFALGEREMPGPQWLWGQRSLHAGERRAHLRKLDKHRLERRSRSDAARAPRKLLAAGAARDTPRGSSDNVRRQCRCLGSRVELGGSSSQSSRGLPHEDST